MSGILEEIKLLTEKANKYENQKGRYIDQAKKIQQAIQILQTLLKDIDPYLDVVKTKGRRYGAERKNIIVECLEKMNNGTEITSKHLQDIYGLSAGNAGNVMAKIEKNKNVGRRKDKGRLRLFIERET